MRHTSKHRAQSPGGPITHSRVRKDEGDMSRQHMRHSWRTTGGKWTPRGPPRSKRSTSRKRYTKSTAKKGGMNDGSTGTHKSLLKGLPKHVHSKKACNDDKDWDKIQKKLFSASKDADAFRDYLKHTVFNHLDSSNKHTALKGICTQLKLTNTGTTDELCERIRTEYLSKGSRAQIVRRFQIVARIIGAVGSLLTASSYKSYLNREPNELLKADDLNHALGIGVLSAIAGLLGVVDARDKKLTNLIRHTHLKSRKPRGGWMCNCYDENGVRCKDPQTRAHFCSSCQTPDPQKSAIRAIGEAVYGKTLKNDGWQYDSTQVIDEISKTPFKLDNVADRLKGRYDICKLAVKKNYEALQYVPAWPKGLYTLPDQELPGQDRYPELESLSFLGEDDTKYIRKELTSPAPNPLRYFLVVCIAMKKDWRAMKYMLDKLHRQNDEDNVLTGMVRTYQHIFLKMCTHWRTLIANVTTIDATSREFIASHIIDNPSNAFTSFPPEWRYDLCQEIMEQQALFLRYVSICKYFTTPSTQSGDQEMTKSGYLEKLSMEGGVGRWRQSYFIVSTYDLKFYENENDITDESNLKGQIQLQTVSNVIIEDDIITNDTVIELQYGGDKKMGLRSPINNDATAQWKEVFEGVVHKRQRFRSKWYDELVEIAVGKDYRSMNYYKPNPEMVLSDDNGCTLFAGRPAKLEGDRIKDETASSVESTGRKARLLRLKDDEDDDDDDDAKSTKYVIGEILKGAGASDKQYQVIHKDRSTGYFIVAEIKVTKQSAPNYAHLLNFTNASKDCLGEGNYGKFYDYKGYVANIFKPQYGREVLCKMLNIDHIDGIVNVRGMFTCTHHGSDKMVILYEKLESLDWSLSMDGDEEGTLQPRQFLEYAHTLASTVRKLHEEAMTHGAISTRNIMFRHSEGGRTTTKKKKKTSVAAAPAPTTNTSIAPSTLPPFAQLTPVLTDVSHIINTGDDTVDLGTALFELRVMGTAVERLKAVEERVRDMNNDWTSEGNDNMTRIQAAEKKVFIGSAERTGSMIDRIMGLESELQITPAASEAMVLKVHKGLTTAYNQVVDHISCLDLTCTQQNALLKEFFERSSVYEDEFGNKIARLFSTQTQAVSAPADCNNKADCNHVKEESVKQADRNGRYSILQIFLGKDPTLAGLLKRGNTNVLMLGTVASLLTYKLSALKKLETKTYESLQTRFSEEKFNEKSNWGYPDYTRGEHNDFILNVSKMRLAEIDMKQTILDQIGSTPPEDDPTKNRNIQRQLTADYVSSLKEYVDLETLHPLFRPNGRNAFIENTTPEALNDLFS